MPDDKDIQIAKSLADGGTDSVCTFLALAGFPLAAAALKSGQLGMKFVASFHQTRAEKQAKRAEQLLKGLVAAASNPELAPAEPPDSELPDVFVSVLEDAIKDDEERKLPFYECCLSWMQLGNPKPTPAQARMLGNAVKNLTYIELFTFICEAAGVGARNLPQAQGIPLEVFWNRVSTFAINNGAGRGPANTTPIGKILSDYVDRTKLFVPSDFAGTGIGPTRKQWNEKS